jgi:radical SAM superfamily enzyme YgiQ (UPF0313 family)
MLSISLISPPIDVLPYPPWGLYLIANTLKVKDKNVSIKLFDINLLKWEKERIPWDDIEGDVIGVSLNFSIHHNKYINFLKRLRNKFPNSIICVGGTHATCIAKYLSKQKCIDHIFYGNGEELIIQFIISLLQKEPINKVIKKDISSTDLFYYCKKDIKYINLLLNHDLKRYDKHHIKYPAIIYKGLPSRHIFFQRSCPFNCKYCIETLASSPRSYLPKIEDTIFELIFRNRFSNINTAYFLDPTFNSNKELTDNLMNNIINLRKSTIWGCKARIELLNNEIIEKLSISGCRFIEVGIEAFDEKTTRYIGKSAFKEDMKYKLDKLTKKGISIQMNCILGFPNDNYKLIMKRIIYAHKLMREFNILPCFWIFCPYPGSQIWNDIGMKSEYIDWEILSMNPVLSKGKIRNHFAYLPKSISKKEMSDLVYYAWKMPSIEIKNWFNNNELLAAALTQGNQSFDNFIKNLFYKEIGDFINSCFFII